MDEKSKLTVTVALPDAFMRGLTRDQAEEITKRLECSVALALFGPGERAQDQIVLIPIINNITSGGPRQTP